MTLQPTLPPVGSVTLHLPTAVSLVWLTPDSVAVNGVVAGAVLDSKPALSVPVNGVSAPWPPSVPTRSPRPQPRRDGGVVGEVLPGVSYLIGTTRRHLDTPVGG